MSAYFHYMAEKLSEEQKEIVWKTQVVDSGFFDSIPRPEEGYKVGKAVAGRDGIVYGVVGIRPDGRLELSKNEETKEVALVVDKSFVRPGQSEALVNKLIEVGLVSKPGKNVKFISEREWLKGENN